MSWCPPWGSAQDPGSPTTRHISQALVTVLICRRHDLLSLLHQWRTQGFSDLYNLFLDNLSYKICERQKNRGLRSIWAPSIKPPVLFLLLRNVKHYILLFKCMLLDSWVELYFQHLKEASENTSGAGSEGPGSGTVTPSLSHPVSLQTAAGQMEKLLLDAARESSRSSSSRSSSRNTSRARYGIFHSTRCTIFGTPLQLPHPRS